MALFNFGVLASIAHSFRRMWPTLPMVETPTGTAVNLQGDANGYPYVHAVGGAGGDPVEVEGTTLDGAVPDAADAPVTVGGIVLETDPAALVDGIIKRLRLDYLQRLWVRSAAYDPATQSDRNFPIVDLASRRVDTPVALLAADQNVTNAWADLGPEIALSGYTRLSLWLDVTHNTSVNVRVRVLAKHTAAGTQEYVLPILKADTSVDGSYVVKAEDEYIELNVDATQSMLLTWVIDNTVPYIQFQVMAETVNVADVIESTTSVTYAWGQ